jgi:hemin uptake protein HemP
MIILVKNDFTLLERRRSARSSRREKGAELMNAHNAYAFRGHRHHSDTEVPQRLEPNRLSVRTLSSNALFAGDHEIGIEHHGALYRLKITRQGKLILNK